MFYLRFGYFGVRPGPLPPKSGTLNRMTTVELLTPFGSVSDVVELSKSGIYRKQILPFRTIDYTAPDGSTR